MSTAHIHIRRSPGLYPYFTFNHSVVIVTAHFKTPLPHRCQIPSSCQAFTIAYPPLLQHIISSHIGSECRLRRNAELSLNIVNKSCHLTASFYAPNNPASFHPLFNSYYFECILLPVPILCSLEPVCLLCTTPTVSLSSSPTIESLYLVPLCGSGEHARKRPARAWS